jgi:uncharacterized protein YkwD
MRSWSVHWLVPVSLALVLAVPASAGAVCRGAHRPATADTLRHARHAVRCLINRYRVQNGLWRLHRNPRLQRAATRQSRDMVRRHYFDHVSPQGSTIVTRARRARYIRPGMGWSIGENIGWAPAALKQPAAMVRGWMASPPHAANILSPAFRDVGIGVAMGTPFGPGGVTYTADFGARGP